MAKEKHQRENPRTDKSDRKGKGKGKSDKKKGKFNSIGEVVEGEDDEGDNPEGRTAAAKRLLASLNMQSEGPAKKKTYRVWNAELKEFDVFELVDGEDEPQPDAEFGREYTQQELEDICDAEEEHRCGFQFPEHALEDPRADLPGPSSSATKGPDERVQASPYLDTPEGRLVRSRGETYLD